MGNSVDYNQLLYVFTSIIYEALPFVVLGVILAGLLEEFVPQQLIARLVPRTKLMTGAAIAVGGLLGLIFPMCECGIIPVMRRLLRKGVPLSVCVAYMLAGPIINVVVILSTMAAFSGRDFDIGAEHYVGRDVLMASMRVGFGFVVAFITGIIVERQHRKYGSALLAAIVVKDLQAGVAAADMDESQAPRTAFETAFDRIGHITETAIHDFIDIMAFLVLGAILATAGRLLIPLIGVETIVKQSPVLGILLMMAFAVGFCLCSEADAFVAANFQPIDLWSLSSKLAFLVLGPMLDFKLYLMYTRVFRQRLIFVIISSVVIQVFVYMTLLYYFGESWLEYWDAKYLLAGQAR